MSLLSQLSRRFSSRPRRAVSRRRRRSHSAVPAEVLEERVLLTLTLDWTTRGGPGNDIDNFGFLFGVNAEAARDTVQSALDMSRGHRASTSRSKCMPRPTPTRER